MVPAFFAVFLATSPCVVPKGAAEVGLTKCALHQDFTVRQQIDCLPKNWNEGIWWWWWSTPFCVSQAEDPVYHNLAMDFALNVTSANQPGIAMETLGNVSFPLSVYYEIELRQTPLLAGVQAVFWTWTVGGTISADRAGSEDDVMEYDPASTNGYADDIGEHNWGAGNNIVDIMFGWFDPIWATLDPHIYHKFGMRTVWDGFNRTICVYIDGDLKKCDLQPGGVTEIEREERSFLIFNQLCQYWINPQGYPCGVGNEGQVSHYLVKSISVYSCPSWRSTQCQM